MANELFVMRRDGQQCGLLVSETDSHYRVNLFGAWDIVLTGDLILSGELFDLPKHECRVFLDMESMAEQLAICVAQNSLHDR